MGNDNPKQKNYNPQLDKQKFEIACLKVKAHLEIQRDKKINVCANKEKQLLNMIQAQQRSKVDEVHKASAIVTDINFIDGCNIVIRYCDILKERSLQICQSKGSQDPSIQELLGFVESVVWSASTLSINALQEFKGMMMMFYGIEMINVDQSPRVDPELKKNLSTLLPNPRDINNYMVKFSQKTAIPLQVINQPGHEFTDQPQPSGLLVFPQQQQIQIQQPPQSNYNLPNQQQPNTYQNFGVVQIPQYPAFQLPPKVEIAVQPFQQQQNFPQQQQQQFIQHQQQIPLQQQYQQPQQINQHNNPQLPIQQQYPQQQQYGQQWTGQGNEQQQQPFNNYQNPQFQQQPFIPVQQQIPQQSNHSFIPNNQQQQQSQQQFPPYPNQNQQIQQQPQQQSPQFFQQPSQQPTQQQQQAPIIPQQQSGSDELDSFEARLKKLRGGN